MAVVELSVKRALLIYILVCFPVHLFGSAWYEDYEKARSQFKKGNCAEAEKLFQTALQKNPKPDVKARPYGTITLEYIPQYYLAKCAVERGDMKQAAGYLKEAQLHGIQNSTLAKDFDALKQKVTTESKALEAGIAIVVNTGNSLKDIAAVDLKEIYLGNKIQWQNGAPITPVLLSPGSKLNDFFLMKICGMDEAAFNAYWEKRGNVKILPMFVEHDEWIIRYIEGNPGAIGFMDSGKTGPLHVITLNGKSANTQGYLLSAD
jgi:tetratricopeptide (TPR) repeat protein